jgi:hypothetical protein
MGAKFSQAMSSPYPDSKDAKRNRSDSDFSASYSTKSLKDFKPLEPKHFW